VNNQNEVFAKVLKDQNLSLTKPRLITFQVLSAKGPLTTAELLKATEGLADRASIYRSIKLFEKSHIAQRLYMGWKYKLELSDTFQEHHHHFTCQNCGSTTPINDHRIEDLIKDMSSLEGFKVLSHQIEVQGLCNKCQKLIKA
jgi:Fur family ferric uptake transcriptional regulator